MSKYTATATATFQVEFEDNGELVLIDQAHEAAMDIINEPSLLDLVVTDVRPVTEGEAA